jgi:hypothetical protein
MADDDARTSTPTPVAVAGRAVVWLVLAWLLIGFARHSIASNYAGRSFLHLPNLVFHEAGHVVFGLLGLAPRFVMVLGGSALQVIVPAVCALAFWRRGDRFAAAVGVWWLGQNFVDLAPYIGDARALRLVLLGGRTGAEVEGHDWEYLLQALGLLQRDHLLARLAHLAGLFTMGGALVWAALELRRQYREQRSGGSGSMDPREPWRSA